MPPWESRAETARRGITLYFCSRHDDGIDRSALPYFYQPRLPSPTVTIQGPLTRKPEFWTWLRSISSDAGDGTAIRDLPVIPLQTALFIDEPSSNSGATIVSTREMRRYGLLLAGTPYKGYVAASVRRLQNGPFADDDDDPIAESSDFAVAEMVLRGKQLPTIERAVRALATDIEDKLRHRLVGAFDEPGRRMVAPMEYRGEQSQVGINAEIEEYIEALHADDDLFALWKHQNSRSTPKKGVYVCLADDQGAWQGRGVVGPWALLRFELKGHQDRDIQLLLRDSRHCGDCGWCVHGLV